MLAQLLDVPAPQTTNTDLAAALSAVGIPLNKDVPSRVMTGDCGAQVCFFFQDRSPCGLYETVELIKAWDDAEWHEKHPEHPFAYLKVAFQNQKRLRDYAKRQVPIGAVKRGSKIAFLSLAASDDLQKKVFQKLNSKKRY